MPESFIKAVSGARFEGSDSKVEPIMSKRARGRGAIKSSLVQVSDAQQRDRG